MTAPALLALLLACDSGPDPVAQALAPWPQDPDALIASCPEQPWPELVITCRVQAAATFGRRGAAARAREICAEIPVGTWRDECHFRAGEELGHGGHTISALGHCADAGDFARNCLTHAAWRLPPDPALTPATPPAAVSAAADELISAVDRALKDAPPGVAGEGRDVILAQFGFNLYVGRGTANPDAARVDGAVGAALRTGLASELAQTLESPGVDSIVAVWRGRAPPPTVDPRSPEPGRFHPPVLSPNEVGVPHLPLFGGGLRLVGETTDEDMTIAALEAMFWREATPAEVFLDFIDDPRPRVRWTAAKLLRLTPPASVDLEATLKTLAADHPDPNIRWHAADGLARKTWVRRPPR